MDIGNTLSRTSADQARRKTRHLEVCLDRPEVETGDPLFDQVHFIHQGLPELDFASIDTSTEFLGHRVALPLFISCMTGGSAMGARVNRELALAAQALRIPLGLGSISILLSDTEAFTDFHVKGLAPEVPVMANIGAVRLRDTPFAVVEGLLDRLEVQAVVVHLNPGQELFQDEGDRDFRGVLDAIRAFAERSSYPVLVKETGFGLSPLTASRLLQSGVRYVDVAGSGGTNWAMVETLRGEAGRAPDIGSFADWGTPTALLLAALGRSPLNGDGTGGSRILASGGIRNAGHLAKSIALGAALAGMALPMVRSVVSGGRDAVVETVKALRRDLAAMMLLVGAKDVAALSKTSLWFSPAFSASLESFLLAEGSSSVGGVE